MEKSLTKSLAKQLGELKLRVKYIDTAILMFLPSRKVIRLWNTEKSIGKTGIYIYKYFQNLPRRNFDFHYCIVLKNSCYSKQKFTLYVEISIKPQAKWISLLNNLMYFRIMYVDISTMNITRFYWILYVTFYHFYNWIHNQNHICYLWICVSYTVYVLTSQLSLPYYTWLGWVRLVWGGVRARIRCKRRG